MEIIEECMKMTSFGGHAKSLALKAIQYAREGDMTRAGQTMDEAEEYLQKSHVAHTNLLSIDAEVNEDGQNAMPVSFFMVHAADHLSSADTIIVLVKELLYIYGKEE